MTLAKLATDPVNSSKIVDGSIAAGDLASNSVTTAKITDANVTAAKLDNTLSQYVGINNGSNVGRGKSIITTEEGRSNAAYATLTTPDQVSNIVLPTDGLIFVAYQATWKETVSNAATAAIFIGSSQLASAHPDAGAAVPNQFCTASLASYGAGVGRWAPLSSYALGLVSYSGAGSYSSAHADYAGDVTTGQAIGGGIPINIAGAGSPRYVAGGVCQVFAAAGTYTVSVRYAASSGTVTAKNRKLWVWTLGF